MTIVDTLITEYQARDRASHAADAIARANDRLHGILLKVGAALAAIDVAHKAIDFAGRAQKAASEYISLEARMKALVGTAEDAKRKLQIAELVAAPSPFTTKQLSDAAVTLEAFGLSSERALPLIGRLGAAMGAGNEQVREFARAFGELAQGNMIDKDVLSAMGMSKGDFIEQGIKFDGGGQLLSSARETLDALEAIIMGKFGNILTEIADTPEAKRASLEDAGEKVMRIIGMGMLRAGAPWMESMTRVLTALVNSGVLEEVTGKITEAITGAFGGDKTEGIARFVARVLSFLYGIPDAIRAITSYFSEAWRVSLTNVERFFDNLEARALNFADTIAAKVGNFFGFGSNSARSSTIQNGLIPDSWIRSIATFFQQQSPPWAPRFQSAPVERPMRPYESFPAFPNLSTAFSGRAKEFEKRLLEALMQEAPSLPDTSGFPWLKKEGGEEAEKTLELIAKHTGSMADAFKPVDVRSILFGGGDRARAGISFADLARGRGGMGGYTPRGPMRLDVRVSKGASDLERALAGVVRQLLPEVSRALGVPIGGL